MTKPKEYSMFKNRYHWLKPYRSGSPAAMLTGLIFILFLYRCAYSRHEARTIEDFNKSWKFHLGSLNGPEKIVYNDSGWRVLNLPHDWSIEGEFSPDHPATTGGGALPGGIGWYRKSFQMPENKIGKLVFVDFDGIYMNSTVWINGHKLGNRPSGYIAFRYELTPYLKYGDEINVIAVKADNSLQPNSRWYTGSGIYRKVRLVITDPVHIAHWGTFISTPEINEKQATVLVETKVRNDSDQDQVFTLRTVIYHPEGKKTASVVCDSVITKGAVMSISQKAIVGNPMRWSIHTPNLYRAVSQVEYNGNVRDDYETVFGIRTFSFNSEKGFFLNGKPTKIHGVCNHHDLGCLGAAVNKRALERQLEILKTMGCNSIRTAHNPPAPELLDLCDRMGFLVMDEMFDMWKKNKSPYDYALYWDEWHEQDLRDFILRDRNHPCVFVWSIGNEILEQWNESGTEMARELAAVVRKLDTTRPITSGLNDPRPGNYLVRSGVLDLIGFNYHHGDFETFPENFPGQKFIAAETSSGLATRGYYDMPSDSIRRWPPRWDLPLLDGNPDHTCSSYDNCSAPWGSTQEETWKIVRKHDFLSGVYVWTGFDYLGEPTPYSWPSRSSYFGLIDLAGFPKDAFYFYQSEWTEKPVLHVFPHWNWEKGKTIDVWAYTNCEEVELFLNNESQGIRKKSDKNLHLMWRLSYRPGSIKAVGRSGGGQILTREIKTAGTPSKIVLHADRYVITADGKDLSFVTVRILDQDGVFVPLADNPIRFEINGEGVLAGVDNGLQTSHESFQSNQRKAFHGLCLAVIRSTENPGEISLKALSDGLEADDIVIVTK